MQVGGESTAAVTVYVNDVNDNRPVFSFPRTGNNTLTLIAASVNQQQQQQQQGQWQVRAFDLDRGNNGVVRYRLLAGNGSALIAVINSESRIYREELGTSGV